MRVVIAGATGFIGQALCRELAGDYEIVALSRDAKKASGILAQYGRVVEWDGRTTSGWAAEASGARAIVNLAGEPIVGRWSQSTKASIRHSRFQSAKAVIDAIEAAHAKPDVFVQGSAIGFYGLRTDEVLDEESSTGRGFLADVCRRLEGAAAKCEAQGVRSVIARTGVVLGRDGGALPKLMRPFRFYLGGHVGNGKQWFSWISLQDEVRAIRFLIENGAARGAFNLTAPEPVTMKAFCQALGQAMGRPCWTAVPGPAVHLLAGEMAKEVLLAGQRVIPKRLMEAGFEFTHSDAAEALASIIQGEEHGRESA